MDFFSVSSTQKNGKIVIEPAFKVKKTRDFMIRGRAFYAIWDEENHIWSRQESDVSRLVDEELNAAMEEQQKVGNFCDVVWMSNYNKGSWQRYKSYLSNMFDTYMPLDTKVTFRSQVCERKDYRSKRLPYDLEDGEPEAYNELMSALYSKEERRKLEWAIGSVLNGDSSIIQKFIVLYGEPGAGKSTFLHIVEQLFDGYWTTFDAKSLTGKGSGFSTHFFSLNPLVAIQHDGDLSKIDDGTLLNSIISHEDIVVNEKFKAQYVDRSNCFLFIGTNSPVKISDSKSGLIRRLIDVSPSGKRVPTDRYFVLMDLIPFELGKIANRCLKIYRALGKKYYNNYKPLQMMYMTDPFFNFVNENMEAFLFGDDEYISLSRAYDVYTNWCETAKEPYILKRSKFRDELKSYFNVFREEAVGTNGKLVKSVYSGFRKELFDPVFLPEEVENPEPLSLVLDCDKSIFDKEYASCLAQYATDEGIPSCIWDKCKTTLADLDTTRCHYVKLTDPNHIVIDFDLKNPSGEKDAYLNLKEASKWPPTYAEFSQGGAGVHLHYIYDGDVSKLTRLVSEGIEVKVFTGKSSLRRRLSKCNNLPIAHISTGIPLKKEVKKMIDKDSVQNEKHLRRLIEMGLRKEVHANTTPSMHFIAKVLNDAYESGISYDVRDLRSKIFAFAMGSTNQAESCIGLIDGMKFCSDDHSIPKNDTPFDDEAPIVFFDIELFPNHFHISWKFEGTSECVHMFNPGPDEVEALFKYKLIGFNNRKYDNHILYARYLGWSVEELYKLSNNIINEEGGILKYGFREAYNISYTDVYDFAAKKQGLKKWEIELGIHHQECPIPFDQKVTEDQWGIISSYCDNDVVATEKLFNHLKGDFAARLVLAKLAGLTPNNTTNELTKKIIFGNDRNPSLNYVHLEERFPGYEFKYNPETRKMENWYRDTNVGFGGYVYGKEGYYRNVALLDIASMHPTSLICMNYLGKYTKVFKALVDARVYIKHGDLDSARELMDGVFKPFLEDDSLCDDLAQALKIAINSVYGLTSASFTNPFRHPENKNNIVALRGALFMRTLQDEVESRGYTVVSIRTDSIKIADADDSIIDFCMRFAMDYGYTFEHEATYDRMCLTTKADYIAKYDDHGVRNKGGKHAGEWTATGAFFSDNYIFNTLFAKKPVNFEDMCQAKEVKAPAALYLDMNENLPDVTAEEKLLEKALKNRDSDEAYISDLKNRIAKGHNYVFIGRVGSFVPVSEGNGGGMLVTKRGDKYVSTAGSKGYRWLEDETVKSTNEENKLDQKYYREMANNAIEAIEQYVSFDEFVS